MPYNQAYALYGVRYGTLFTIHTRVVQFEVQLKVRVRKLSRNLTNLKKCRSEFGQSSTSF